MTPKPSSVFKRGIQRVDYERYHRYKIDGRWALGVTTALKGVPKDDVLKRWAARLVAEHAVDNLDELARRVQEFGAKSTAYHLADLPNQRRDSAAVRGTEVHAIAEKYIKGDEVEVPEDLYPYVEGFAAYIEDFQPVTMHEELVVASREYMLAGTLDSIQHVPGHGVSLVDYKTSKGVYGTNALQVAAYRHMEVYLDADGNEQPMPEVESTFVLHIRPHDYQLIPVKAGREEFGKFLAAAENYRQNVQSNKLDKLLGVALDPPSREAA